jgi:hypothetical protein
MVRAALLSCAPGTALRAKEPKLLTLIDLVVGVNTFHEKAGRSQGDWFWYLLVTLFLSRRVATVATLPSALFAERFASLGASWVFSFQPMLPSVYRPFFHLSREVGQAINAVTGTRL